MSDIENDRILRKIRYIQYNNKKDYKNIDNVMKDTIKVGIENRKYHLQYLELGHFQWNFIWSIVYKPELALGILYFFSNDVNVHYVDKYGRNFFYFIRDSRLVPILIDIGLDINHRDCNNNTPLYYHTVMSFSYSSDTEVLSDIYKLQDEMIKYGAKIDNE